MLKNILKIRILKSLVAYLMILVGNVKKVKVKFWSVAKLAIRFECPTWNSNLEWTLVSRSVLSSEWPMQSMTVTSTKPLTVRWTINFLSWNISLLNFPKDTWLGGWIIFLYLWTKTIHCSCAIITALD